MKPQSCSNNDHPPGHKSSAGVQSRWSLAVALATVCLFSWGALAAGPVVQLLWSVPPGSASIGAPFGQQPKLITADAAGQPSTVGLASSVVVTVDSVPAGQLNGGVRTVDIGAAAGNGVVTFSGLEIDSAGGYSLAATAGDGTNEVFSPTNGLPACQLWLDAADAATLTVTGDNNLTRWADKSGTGNDGTSPTAGSLANTPLTNVNANLAAFAPGTQRVVSFQGTNQLNIDLSRITNSTYSIVALTQLDPAETANNDYYLGSAFYANGVDHVLHIGYRNASQYTFAQYADDLDVSAPAAGPVIASHIHGSGTKQIYFDGSLAGENTGGQNDLLTLGQATVGQGNGGNFHGDIAELIVYRTNLTDLQRVEVENYLANKWLGQLSSGTISSPFFVNGGSTPKGIRFTQQPTDATAGVNLSPGVSVMVTNAAGAGVAGLPVFLSLAEGAGPLGGTLSQTTDGTGTATFGDLNLTVAGQKQLAAYIPGVLTNTSATFNVAAAAPAQLAIVVQPPAAGLAGVVLALPPVVAVEDPFGNVVSNLTDTITASESLNGNLNQTADNAVSVAAISGLATFPGLFLTNAGTGYLTFTDGTLNLAANSANLTIAPNVPKTITVQQEPSASAQVGVALATQPIIEVVDLYGNAVSNGTPVVVTAGANGVLGDGTETTTGGIATFSSLALTNAGNLTLTFAAGTVSVNSTPIAVGAGPVTSVSWTTQPGAATTGVPFGQQPVLKTVDAGGNVTTTGLSATNWVVVHLVSGNGLVGSSRTFNLGTAGSNGVIVFKDLQINTPGANNILAADFVGDPTVPTNTIPNCVLWLDAYDRDSLTLADTNVTAWADKSGTSNNAVNTGNYPTPNLNTALPPLGYGGQHTVNFPGNNWLNVDLSSLSGHPFTVVALDIANPDAATGNSYFFGSGFNGVDATLHMGYRNANTFTFAQYADDLNWTAPSDFGFSTPRIWTGRLDANASQNIFLNGVLEASRTAGSLPGTITNGSIGLANFGHYNGDLAEILVYNRDLTDAERILVEQYLSQKWLSNSRALTAPFTVGSLSASLALTSAAAGGRLTLTLSGAAGQSYRLLTTTNLTQPLSLWQGVATNTLDGTGLWHLVLTNQFGGQFYQAVTP